MVSKSRSPLRDSRFVLSDSDLARQIGAALREELGATRRATKTVMRWTGVSDTTARTWLQGKGSPSGIHMVTLAAHSDPVMIALLRLTGRGDLELGLRMREVEGALVELLTLVRETRSGE